MPKKRKRFKKASKLLVVVGSLSLLMLSPIHHNDTLGKYMDSLTGRIEAQAAEAVTFSQYWSQDGSGTWHVYDASGGLVRNAWLCDDAVASNGRNIWYLIDADGNMVFAGLVQDQTGNYYSLETNHNGYYGMLRYQSGEYDGIPLVLNGEHAGSFAAVQNADGLDMLRARYGVTVVNIDNSNIVYTSSFSSGSSGGSFAGSGGGSVTNDSGNAANDDSSGNVVYYNGMELRKPDNVSQEDWDSAADYEKVLLSDGVSMETIRRIHEMNKTIDYKDL